ncbi:MAG: sugar ABC transporter permease, partial [Methylococcales bacterium]|nr:sugar ABC transporter permease [Methylococcales bacterium]
IFSSFKLSLNRIAPFGSKTIFVGLGNYTRLLADPDYLNSLKVTFLFILGVVPGGIIIAVIMGLALSYPLKRLSWFHRLLIFIPIVISSAVTGVLFRWIYHPVVGYINYALSLIGVDGPNWLSSKEWALFAVMIAVIWRQLGFNVIIALAGIQNIDGTLYEAAKVDGANLWHRVRHITIPLLSPTLFFLLIINVINTFQVFGEINILTEGGPGGATNTLLYSIFFDAFVGTPFRGYASAQAYLLFLIMLVVSIIQFSGVGRKVHYQ